MIRAGLHMHELVNCRWVEEVTQQLDTLQLQSPGRLSETPHKDMFVLLFLIFVSSLTAAI